LTQRASSPAADPEAADSEPPDHPRRSIRVATLLEALAVVLSPVVAVFVLRLRVMAPSDEPDPSIHTTLYIDPRDIFMRYSALFSPTARLREAARVGFLVPARLAYLAFGAVPGFFVTRYAFALIAIVPVYLLLRRLYGPAAGAVGILVFLTSPVVLTAWGTDYPDSAVVSYMTGALACLAMPCAERWRRWWLAGAAALLTMAIWAHGMGLLLAVCTLAGYVLVRIVKDRVSASRSARRLLLGDLTLMAGIFALLTGILSILSEVLLGHFDFIEPTWGAFRYLSRPDQIAMWHSASWRWAPFIAYILVPPAVVAAYVITFARRKPRDLLQLPMPVLLVGVVAALDVTVFWIMQFFGSLQTLEIHLFSSTLWSATCVALAMTISELARPLLQHRIARWVPAVSILVIVWVYELHPHVPAFGWLPYGFLTAGILIAFAVGARLWTKRAPNRTTQWAGLIVAIMGVISCAMILTVAPVPKHRQLPGTQPDPPPAYATALGGSSARIVDLYRVTAELPLWVGNPTFPGEILVTWWPSQYAPSLNGPVGVFHSGFTSLPQGPPRITKRDLHFIKLRHAAQLLMFSWSGDGFVEGLQALTPDEPRVVRFGVLSSGDVHLHVWLVDLMRFFPKSKG
jgi:hypothetical protein